MLSTLMNPRHYSRYSSRCGIPHRNRRTRRVCRFVIAGLQVLLSLLLALIIAMLFLLAGCTRTTIIEQPTEGTVVIRPDMSTYTLPPMNYHFYPMDGTGSPLVYSCDGQGNFKGTLPTGFYQVIGVNKEVNGAVFREMNQYQTAKVYDTTLNGYTFPFSTRADDFFGSDKIYRVILRDIEVGKEDTVRFAPLPIRVTHVIMVSFTVVGELATQVNGIAGSMQGVYPSALLFDGKTPQEDIQQSPEIRREFTTARNGNIYWARLHLLGLSDPLHGRVYNNVLQLSLDIGGTSQPFEIDLTEHLSDIFEQTDGKLPLNIPFEITLEWKEIEVKSNIKPWEDYGETEIPVPIGL